MIYIGQRTLIIMMLHFLSFKAVAVLVDLIYNLPAYCIAAFPTLYGNIGFWWIAYTIVGVALPLLLDLVFQTVKDCVSRKRYSNRSY